MKTTTMIKFTTTESKNKLTAGKICYQGHLAHNHTLSPKETLAGYAEYSNLRPSMAKFAVESLGGFIAQEVARGNRLDFGTFAVSLNLCGGFPADNSPFDSKKNEISVELTPGKEIREAVCRLKPMNDRAGHKPCIYNTLQIEPEKKFSDIIDTNGVRKLSVVGYGFLVHPDATGEGAWIEDDLGNKLITGAVYSSDYGLCKLQIDVHIDPGKYWMVVCGRESRTDEFIEVRRRITAK